MASSPTIEARQKKSNGQSPQARAAAHELAELAAMPAVSALARLSASAEGLSTDEAAARLKQYGPNRISSEAQAPILVELWDKVKNPLNGLLLALAALSWILS